MINTSPIQMVVSPSMTGKPRGTLATVYAPHALRAARRFQNTQGALLRGDLALPAPSVRLVAFLIAFDGIVTRSSLVDAFGACRDAYIWNKAICIEWIAACGRTDRRHLSAWTQFALSHPDALLSSAEQAVFQLDQCFQNLPIDQKYPRSIDTLLEDGQAWLALNLAGPWFSHAIGAVRLAALPRSVFARESSKLALNTITDEELAERDLLADSAIGQALDGYLSDEVTDGGYWLVDEIMASCAASATRKAMVKSLLTIATKHSKGRISSLILAWVTDLAESGTQREANISPRTVSKYVRSIARDLLDEFRGKSLEQLESKNFDQSYRKIIACKSAGTQHTCASALSSWHFFLECWLDVAPRRESLHRDLPKPIPKANILWPHEVNTIAEWLAKANEKSRLILQAGVAFGIASTIRIRTNELLKLRLKNIRLIGNAVEVEICTAIGDGGLKSPNARRTQTIECPATADLLRGWKQNRLQELAMPNDYLFGDPYRAGKPYCLGQMQTLMNRLLKIVTGDPSVSIHTFSHSWATGRFKDASPDESATDINLYDALSVEAGHGDASMTIASYVHRYEEAIRSGIDIAVSARLRWPEMSPFMKMSHDAYRQRLSRQALSMPDVDEGQRKLNLLRTALPVLELPAADSGIRTTEPKPAALISGMFANSLGMVIDVLTDIAAGMTVDLVALRACREEEEIVRIIHLAKEFMSILGEFSPASRAQSSPDVTGELFAALQDAMRGRIEFAKISQKKLLALREVLSNGLNDPNVGAAARSWLKCYRYGYVSLAHPSHAASLVRLLRHSGVSASAIGIFHIPTSKATVAHLAEEIDAVFIQEYAAMPMKVICGVRGGRPPAYFSIAGTDFQERTSSATLCMKGFNALLLSTCVAQRLSSQN